MKKLREISLLDILPDSILADKKIRASAQALDFQFQSVTNAIREVLHIPRLDELNGTILDYLAEQLHVDFYEPLGLSDETKRNLIRESIALHRLKGTPAAVERLAKAAFRDAEVTEWFQYSGKPYSFRVKSHGYIQTPDGWKTFLRMLNAAKNVRSWLDGIDLVLDDKDLGIAQAYAGVANLITGSRTIEPAKPDLTYQTNAFAQNADFVYGEVVESLKPPKLKFEVGAFAGMLNSRTGKIKIDSKTRPADDSSRLVESWQSKFYVGNVNFVFGRKTINTTPRTVETSKVFVENFNIAGGFVTVEPDTKRKFAHQTTAHAAQVLTKVGSVKIGSENKSSTDENLFGVTGKAKVTAGTVTHKSGIVKIKDSSRRIFDFGNVVRVGMTNTFSGFVTIGFAPITHYPATQGLTLSFDLSDRIKRLVNVDSPRDDISKADISAVGAHEALLNGQLITAENL